MVKQWNDHQDDRLDNLQDEAGTARAEARAERAYSCMNIVHQVSSFIYIKSGSCD